MYAVVQTGGQQHKVSVGHRFLVDKLPDATEVGGRVELDRVLMIGGDEGVVIGAPTVAGARVVAEVIDPDAKGKKLVVFKYKSKVRYRRKTGHRQHYTQLKVTEIVPGDGPLTAHAPAQPLAVGMVAEAAPDPGAAAAKNVQPGGGADETSSEKKD